MNDESREVMDSTVRVLETGSQLSAARIAELAPKLEELVTELAKLDEIVPIDGEPATPWPWSDDDEH